ncbi:potassium-transporting ATPase subunit F [Rhodovarius crocodyli]|uniref:Potassium-transporting ATPase subunit F n=1 Tax=Rhodovarius crocodyli TaxID=1979269 RepID=A0A437LX95_9PROT|nr:potassium-transporting ATPase subunit F [Rhodovarius crocodyli]
MAVRNRLPATSGGSGSGRSIGLGCIAGSFASLRSPYAPASPSPSSPCAVLTEIGRRAGPCPAGNTHARHHHAHAGGRRLRADGPLCRRLRPGLTAMTELLLGGGVALGLLLYLFWALLRPESL